MEIPSDIPLSKYEKVEMIVLGITIPALLIIWTLYQLIVYSEAIYIFHDEPVYFTGIAAYLVCWFWFGLSLVLFAHFVLGKKRRYYSLARKQFKCGVLLVFSSTLVAVWYTFELYKLLP